MKKKRILVEFLFISLLFMGCATNKELKKYEGTKMGNGKVPASEFDANESVEATFDETER